MIKFLFLFTACLLANIAAAQTGGESVYQFLSLSTSSNYASIGGKAPATRISGPNSVWANPALMDSTSATSAALNMVSYVADIRYGSALYSHRIKDLELTAGVMVLNYGDFALTDEAANELGTFRCHDGLAMASLSFPAIGNLRAGASLKYIFSSMETYRSQGLAIDMGLYYTMHENLTSLGLVIQNLGCQITTYCDTRESLPLNISLGVSRKLMHAPIRFSLTAHSINHPKLGDRFLTSLANHLIIAAELFPEGVISLKGGFNFLAHNDMYVSGSSLFPGFSAGVDVRLKRFSVQYSRQCLSPAASANMFSTEIFIGKFWNK